ncbi:MAG: monoamine oxidase, partial [Granulosicoccus sp.]
MKHSNAKVGIVGGGLAGIYTAYLLQKNCISFQLLEAKPFLGGRIYGEVTQSDGYKVDLGPSWVFPHQHKIQQLVQTLGLKLVDQFNQGDAIFQRNANETPQQVSGQAPPPMYRIAGGTTQLIETLAERIPSKHIALDTTVSKLEFNGEFWGVYTSSMQDQECSKSLQFEHIVIAMPPRITADKLTLSSIFASQLSPTAKPETNATSLEKLLHKFASTPTWMSAQAKFVVIYKTPFWREHGLSGQAFSHVGPMVEIHDASHEDESGKSVYALFGFIGVPFPQRQQISKEAMNKACTAQLISLFGKDASEYLQTYIKDWATDSLITSALDQTQGSSHPQIELRSERAWLSHVKLH